MTQLIQKSEFKTDGNFAIHVTDLKKAEEFYGNVLGFKLKSKSDKYLEFNTGKITLYVNLDDKIIPYIPALIVDDFENAKQNLLKKGCSILKDSEWNKTGYFTDPFGIVFDVTENS